MTIKQDKAWKEWKEWKEWKVSEPGMTGGVTIKQDKAWVEWRVSGPGMTEGATMSVTINTTKRKFYVLLLATKLKKPTGDSPGGL